MENKKIKFFATAGIVSVFALGTFVGISGINNSRQINSRASNTREVVDVTDTSISLNNNYSVAAVSEGFTDGNLFSLSEYGYLRNTEPIRGITSISITYGGESAWAKIVPCYYDYEIDEVVTPKEWPEETSKSADFTASPIDYFEIYNPNETDITITSISIIYGCTTSTYTFELSFTPNWNGKTAPEHADIYIAGTPELISDGISSGGWNFQKLTYNDGVYSYTSPNYLPTGVYTYSLYASKSGAAINWGNKTSTGEQELFLTANKVDSTSYAWDQEPGSATTYILNIVYNETSSGFYSKWRGFQYSTSSSDIKSGSWGGNLNWTEGTTYVRNSFEIESTSSTIYVAWVGNICHWNETDVVNYDPAYIGESSSTAFTLNYGSNTSATLTINMTLSEASECYAATSYNVTYTGGQAISGMSHDDVSMQIYDLNKNDKSLTNGKVLINPSFESGTDTFTASFEGNNIRIDEINGNKYITALKAGTTTEVTLTADSDHSVNCTFNVTVPTSTYSATSTRDGSYNGGSQVTSVKEGWFVSTDVDEISGMGSDFFNGVDISSCKALYQNGSNFYNSNGVEESLFYILKAAGVNWIRLKLWVDPYTTGGVSYGGGESDLNNTLWMAYEAKAAGFKVLLDLHYSDYWTHPGQQVLPKAWASANSVSSLSNYIKTYTKNTLNTFNSNGCLPDMVQLGNEISSGSFLKLPGANSESFDSYYRPSYLTAASNFSYSASSGSNNMKAYLTAGVEAVNEINSSLGSDIKTVVHWAKGSSISASVINGFFNGLSSVSYDYAAISFYPYYCFDTMSVAQTILNGLSISNAKGNVPWFIAETSYPFSDGSWVYEEKSGAPTYKVTDGLIGSSTAEITNIFNSYAGNASGQARMIHDLTAATVAAGGKGIFYWEPAWIPNAYVGWAASGSSCSWSNQGFFSYDGKAMANLDLFAQMSPYIN